MKYEAPDMLELGEATTMVLGQKVVDTEVIPNEPQPPRQAVDMDDE